jgi:hypothetical protein
VQFLDAENRRLNCRCRGTPNFIYLPRQHVPAKGKHVAGTSHRSRSLPLLNVKIPVAFLNIFYSESFFNSRAGKLKKFGMRINRSSELHF